jgi:hypothetical protein
MGSAAIAFAGFTALSSTSAMAQAATPVVASMAGPCGAAMQYEEDCIRAITRAITNSAEFSAADKELVYARIRAVWERHAFLKGQIEAILTENNIPLEAPPATPPA